MNYLNELIIHSRGLTERERESRSRQHVGKAKTKLKFKREGCNVYIRALEKNINFLFYIKTGWLITETIYITDDLKPRKGKSLLNKSTSFRHYHIDSFMPQRVHEYKSEKSEKATNNFPLAHTDSNKRSREWYKYSSNHAVLFTLHVHYLNISCSPCYFPAGISTLHYTRSRVRLTLVNSYRLIKMSAGWGVSGCSRKHDTAAYCNISCAQAENIYSYFIPVIVTVLSKCVIAGLECQME